MKQLEFLYQEAQIHFLVNGTQKEMMINATEMAKPFGKRLDHFLRSQHAKSFISEIEKRNEFTPNGGNSLAKILESRGQNGTYFCEELALKFAAWLDPAFELWVYSTIKDITFGRYRKHAQAEEMENEATKEMEAMKHKLLNDPDKESALRYFQAEKKKKKAKNLKQRVLRQQLDLFDNSANR